MRGLLVLFLLICLQSNAADTTKLYNPFANAEADVATAIAKARSENKHVLLQIGGNWCGWCYIFHSFVNRDTSLRKIIRDNFIVYHLNHSRENKNQALLKRFGFPQRFGFPVLVVLDASGQRLHTQETALLEKGASYDAEKVKDFLLNWRPAAVDEANYIE
jgi:thiol:disulfide interchange protein